MAIIPVKEATDIIRQEDGDIFKLYYQCGVCVAVCPSGAIAGKHSTTEQIMAEIEGVLV